MCREYLLIMKWPVFLGYLEMSVFFYTFWQIFPVIIAKAIKYSNTTTVINFMNHEKNIWFYWYENILPTSKWSYFTCAMYEQNIDFGIILVSCSESCYFSYVNKILHSISTRQINKFVWFSHIFIGLLSCDIDYFDIVAKIRLETSVAQPHV